MTPLDIELFRWLNGLAAGSGAGQSIFVFSAEFVPAGTIALALLASIFLLWRQRTFAALQWVAFIWGTSVLTRFLFAELIRRAYPRPRPFEVLPDAIQLIAHDPGGAFPSGHAVFFFALAAGFWLLDRKIGYGFGAVALWIGVSRIIAGVHWPSDFLGGALLGIAVPIVTYLLGKLDEKLSPKPKPAA